MRRNAFCITLIIFLLLAFWYVYDMQKKNFNNELQTAIQTAKIEAIAEYEARLPLQTPQEVIIIEKEIPAKAKKQAKLKTKPIAGKQAILTDARDGQQYPIKEFDGTIWMTANLNFDTEGSWCYQEEVESCEDFGRLYTWHEAVEICPEGWRLPDDSDWSELLSYFGGKDVAGKYLKKDIGDSGFDVIMAGYRDKAGFYGKVDTSAYFWSATMQNESYASFKGFYKDVNNIGAYTYTKGDGFSVRCVRIEEDN